MPWLGDDEELLRDPAALAEARSRYSGSIDIVDVLRWRRDPGALGMHGSRSPMARAGDLRPLIYGRADTPELARQRDAAAAEAESLLAGWAADSAALDAALRPPSVQELLRPGRATGRRRSALFIGAGAVVVAVLIAVFPLLRPSTPASPPLAVPTSTPRPTPAPSTPVPTRTVAPTFPAPPPVVVTPGPPEEGDLRREYYEEDIFTVLQVPIDGGAIDNANGVATIDDYGVPLSYVVANGDVFELIAKRFDIGTTYLASINAVRRENPTELFVGDTLNLGATTILRIGDQNGVVYDFTDRLPVEHLPQD